MTKLNPPDPPSPSDKDQTFAYSEETLAGDEETLLADADAAPATPADAATPHPQTIGPYRLIEKLGEGGMGVVWLAEQTEPVKRQVALKIIKRGMDTRQFVARFEAERQALAMMSHPSVAKVFDAGATPNGRPYYVMEYVDGVPITEYCDNAKLTNRERLELFSLACDGVQHAHQRAIIHRDLKPSNVLVTTEGGRPVPKIIDFGLAKSTEAKLTDRTMVTEIGAMMGTPEYMSPEQAQLGDLDIDTRTDVYSLGVMLYELLAGALPFDSGELRSSGFEGMRRKILLDEPPRPSARLASLGDDSSVAAERRSVDLSHLRSQLTGDLDWVVMRAIEKERERRYGSPADLAADLRRFLTDQPVEARPPTVGYRAAKFVRRHRLGVGISTAAVLVLLGVTVLTLVQADRLAAERDLANRERQSSDRVSEFLADMLADVNVAAMGDAMLSDLTERVVEAERSRGASEEQVAATLAGLEDALAGVNSTDAALSLLDEQILERAAGTITNELAGEPRSACRLQRTISDTYRRLGLYEEAERHARLAVEMGSELGLDDPDVLLAGLSLGRAYDRQTRYDEAERVIADVFERQRRTAPADDPAPWITLEFLGDVYYQQGRMKDAEVSVAEAKAGWAKLVPPGDPATLGLDSSQAILLREGGRFEEAVELFLEVAAGYSAARGPDDGSAIQALENAASTLSDLERYQEALEIQQEVLDRRMEILGADHPDTLGSKVRLAHLLQGLGDLDRAETLVREARDDLIQIAGHEHAETLEAGDALGSILEKDGRFGEAEEVLTETCEAFARSFGADHPDSFSCSHQLGRVQAAQGRHLDAAETLGSALERADRISGPENPRTLWIAETLAETYRELGRMEEAERLAARVAGGGVG